MSSGDELLGGGAGIRIGATFRLLIQVRILLAAVSLLLLPIERTSVSGFLVIVGVGALSGLAAFSWKEIVTWLLARPVLIGFEVFACFAVLEVGGVLGPFFLCTVITSAVVGLLFPRRWLLLVCGLQMFLYYSAVIGDEPGVVIASFQTLIAMPAFYPIAGFIGMKLRRLFEETRDLDDARRRAEVLAAAAEERTRLGREMHDSLAKTLRGIAMSATALPTWVDNSPSRALEEARGIASAAELAAREARELIGDLRTDIVRRPLAEVLHDVATGWSESTGITAHVRVADAPMLPLRVRYELIAIVKEALENVARHADAGSVDITLSVGHERAELTIGDDGNGFTTPGDLAELAGDGHYGVIGMAERAAVVGGELSVRSATGRGTVLTIGVPLLPAPRTPQREPA